MQSGDEGGTGRGWSGEREDDSLLIGLHELQEGSFYNKMVLALYGLPAGDMGCSLYTREVIGGNLIYLLM